MNANELRHQRGKALKAAQAIIDKAGGRLSLAQQAEYDRLVVESEELREAIERQELLDELDRGLPAPGRKIPGIEEKPKAEKAEWRNVETGELIPVLAPDEEIRSDFKPEEANLSIGKFLKGIVTGDWRDAEAEHRTMLEGTLSAGGYMVPTPLSNQLINRARNKAAVFQAGARTVPMEASTLKMARNAGDFSAYWRAENAAITTSDMTFEQVTLTAKTLAAYGKISVELFEDAPNVDQVVSESIASALALELDRAVLVGSGSGAEILGIRGSTGIQSVSMGTNGATPTNWDEFSQLYFAIAAANGTPNAVVYAPRTAGTLDLLKDTTNQPLLKPASMQSIRHLITAQLPIDETQGTSTDCSTAIMGDFSTVMVGMRTNLVLEVSRVAHDGTDSAFNKLQVHIRAYLRADMQLAQPPFMGRLIGIRNV